MVTLVRKDCERCQRERHLRLGDPHPKFCRSCCKLGPPAYPEFERGLFGALKRNALTLREACELAGVHYRTLRKGITGVHRPLKGWVQRLANVLNAPELPPLIPSNPKIIEMTCTACGETFHHRRNILQQTVSPSRGGHPEAIIDWGGGKGRYTCAGCVSSYNLQSWHQREIDRKGRNKHRKELGDLAAAAHDPEQRIRAVKASADARRGKPHPEPSRNQSRGQISAYPKVNFGTCFVGDCGELVMSGSGPKNLDMPANAHRPCLNDWRRENGVAYGSYPPRPNGRLPSSKDLAISWSMAVSHLLKGQPIEGKGELADSWELHPDTIRLRIRTLLRLLPKDGRGGKRLTHAAKLLKEAGRKAGYSF